MVTLALLPGLNEFETVPEIVPSDAKVSPAGSAPDVMAKVYGPVPPLAEMTSE